MDTKANLEQNQSKEQETFTPEDDTKSNAATVEKSATGGSSIVDFDYEKYADVEKRATHTNAIAGLTLGILSLIVVWFFALGGLVLGIVGIVFSIKGRREIDSKGMATGGLVCSVIGTAISSIALILTIFLVGAFIYI